VDADVEVEASRPQIERPRARRGAGCERRSSASSSSGTRRAGTSKPCVGADCPGRRPSCPRRSCRTGAEQQASLNVPARPRRRCRPRPDGVTGWRLQLSTHTVVKPARAAEQPGAALISSSVAAGHYPPRRHARAQRRIGLARTRGSSSSNVALRRTVVLDAEQFLRPLRQRKCARRDSGRRISVAARRRRSGTRRPFTSSGSRAWSLSRSTTCDRGSRGRPPTPCRARPKSLAHLAQPVLRAAACVGDVCPRTARGTRLRLGVAGRRRTHHARTRAIGTARAAGRARAPLAAPAERLLRNAQHLQQLRWASRPHSAMARATAASMAADSGTGRLTGGWLAVLVARPFAAGARVLPPLRPTIRNRRRLRGARGPQAFSWTGAGTRSRNPGQHLPATTD